MPPGSAFGLDPQARRDYGYGADITLAPIAKAIIAAHYGRKPDFSYYGGCSNGGRHTMVAATRMPEPYDGFLVGDPGFDLPRAAIQHAWDAQAFVKADPDIRKSITAEDAALVSRKIIAACDRLDGIEDGLTANLAACQKAFAFDSLVCAAGATADCLPKAKVEALKTSFAGPHELEGQAALLRLAGRRRGRHGQLAAVEGRKPDPALAQLSDHRDDGRGLAAITSSPPRRPRSGVERCADEVAARRSTSTGTRQDLCDDGRLPESAMEFMTPPDMDDPKLAKFRELGRKMIIYHGQADPVFSIDDTIRWYEKLDANLDGRAAEVVRLFAVPGMTHCSDGVALDKFDALTALMDWVEKGKAPDRIIATVDPANKEIPASWSPARTRPLCPWPAYARYTGGDPESADSFECARP